MKRIFAAFLAVLCVLMVCLLPVSASEDAMSDAIYNELRELVAVETYLANANDLNIYLISLVETGYGENGFEKDNAIYLYFYNPSRRVVTSSVLNTVQIATQWKADGQPTDYKKYPLSVQGTALDGLFIRAKIDKPAKELAFITNSTRKYGVSGFELYQFGNYNAEEYEVGYTYEFSGYGDNLKCIKQDFITLPLNVNQVNYISPTGEEDKYNQINSVYFTIPKDIEEEFGKLYSIEYEYYYARTKPMFFTDNVLLYNKINDFIVNGSSFEDFYFICSDAWNTLDGSAFLCNGVLGSSGSYFSQMDSVTGKSYFTAFRRGGAVNVLTEWWFMSSEDAENPLYYEKPGIVLKLPAVDWGNIVMSAAELQKELKEYSEAYSVSKNDLVREKYLKSLFQPLNYDGRDYTYTSYMLFEKNRDDLFDLTVGGHRNWWETIWNLDHPTTTETYEYIQPVSKYDVQSDTFCEDFLVNDIYKDEILEACKNENGDRVYLLHYAASDNYISDDFYVAEFYVDEGKKAFTGFMDWVGLEVSDSLFAVEQDVYLDFDIIKLTFGNNRNSLKTIAAVSSPTDGFADVYSPPKPKLEWPDWWMWIRLALFFVLVIFIIFGVSKIVSFFRAGREASVYREMRKYYRNQNKRK